MRFVADRTERLDLFLARVMPDFSRTKLARLADEGGVRVNGEPAKPRRRVEVGMAVELDPPVERPAHDLAPSEMSLDIVFEDAHLVVVNKPRGLATHPAASLFEPSLVNGLLAYGAKLSAGSAPFRPGIVHRLDKETTGLLVVAKTEASHAHLAAQIAAKDARRLYLAFIAGTPTGEKFDIDAPIGRDPTHRQRMAVTARGKSALTQVRLLRKTVAGSLLGVGLTTGRTHQIRVHLAAVGLPVVGDRLYGTGAGPLQLHAAILEIVHPFTLERMRFTASPPSDYAIVVDSADLEVLARAFEEG